LHSCIVSYSLDIPAIGLAWNDKLLFWGKEIEKPERFFDFNELDYMKVIDVMEKAIKEGYDKEYKAKFMNSIYDFIDKSLDYID